MSSNPNFFGTDSSSRMRICNKRFACIFEGRNRLFASYRGEFCEEYIQAIPSLEVVKKDFERNASSDKDRCPAQNIGVTMHH